MSGRKPVLVKKGTAVPAKPVTEPRKLSERELREKWQRERAAQQKPAKQAWAALWA